MKNTKRQLDAAKAQKLNANIENFEKRCIQTERLIISISGCGSVPASAGLSSLGVVASGPGSRVSLNFHSSVTDQLSQDS